jgi:replicative DNA helicase
MNAHTRDFRPSLPDAIEAEQALLGAVMVNNDAYWRVAGFLKPQHFTDKLHGTLFETMGAMIAEGRPVNPITVKPYIPAGEMVGEITMFAYVPSGLRRKPSPPSMPTITPAPSSKCGRGTR